ARHPFSETPTSPAPWFHNPTRTASLQNADGRRRSALGHSPLCNSLHTLHLVRREAHHIHETSRDTPACPRLPKLRRADRGRHFPDEAMTWFARLAREFYYPQCCWYSHTSSGSQRTPARGPHL